MGSFLVPAALLASIALSSAAPVPTLQSCQEAADAFCNSPASGDGTQPCAHFQPGACSQDRFVARLGH